MYAYPDRKDRITMITPYELEMTMIRMGIKFIIMGDYNDEIQMQTISCKVPTHKKTWTNPRRLDGINSNIEVNEYICQPTPSDHAILVAKMNRVIEVEKNRFLAKDKIRTEEKELFVNAEHQMKSGHILHDIIKRTIKRQEIGGM